MIRACILLASLLLPLTLFACGCDDCREGTDLDRAVAIARRAALEGGHDLERFRLVGAEQIVHRGHFVWRVTWKLEHLFPEDPTTGLIGLGGELFVNVVLATGKTTITHGE